MIDDFGKLEQFTGDEAIRTVLEDHPELKILWERRHLVNSPVVINNINPILHILIEAVVENQIMQNDPPEIELALKRLMGNGMLRHTARTVIASVLVNNLFDILKNQVPFNTEGYSRQLSVLGEKVEKVGRNDPCPCGSGKKFKHCCINKFRYAWSMQSRINSQ
ncbi:MAG: DUF1841 family protein [Firmicutes bacterium]|nr:DUF1841 family protein [Bacillota bacterium]